LRQIPGCCVHSGCIRRKHDAGKSNGKAQRRGEMPLPAGRHADPFSGVGKPLPTSLTAGVPVHVVSQRLGHASPVITLQVYAHVVPGSQRDAADLFARIIAGAAS
jgi:hypothetical protein